eukprot:m.154215 g.154215  ORF g.154215 m.154215 type:complete len:326 (+) comp9787_c0_seq3:33-1010(+)
MDKKAINTVHSMRSYAFCAAHPGAQIVEEYSAGDMVCCECGTVVGDRIIDAKSEWRTFGNSDKGGNAADPSRVGVAQDANDTELASLGQSRLAGADDDPSQRWQGRTAMTGAERSRHHAFKEMERMGAQLNLKGDFVATAKNFYKRIDETKALKSRSRDAIAAACIFLSCRELKNARTIKEISDVTAVPKKDVAKMIKLAMQSLGTVNAPTVGDDLVSRFAGRLNMLFEARRAAIHVAREAERSGHLTGRKPDTIAAASIYLVVALANLDISLFDLSRVSGVADSTIMTSYKIMLPHKDALLPADFQAMLDRKAAEKKVKKEEPL